MASRMSRQAHRAFHDFPISVSLAITLGVGLTIRQGLRSSPCLVIAVPLGIPRTPNIDLGVIDPTLHPRVSALGERYQGLRLDDLPTFPGSEVGDGQFNSLHRCQPLGLRGIGNL